VSRLAQLSLKNRAVVLLTTLALVLGGIFAMTSLKRELLPQMNLPMAVVVAVYPGSAPEVVSQLVSEPIEAAVRGVQGVDSIETTAMSSVSTTMVSFVYGTDMDLANQRLTTAVARLGDRLPSGVETQIITGSMDDLPIIQLAISGIDGEAQPGELATAVNDILVPRLSRLGDVREVTVSGYASTVVTVTVDPVAMAVAGVGMQSVADVLKNNGLSFPVGTVAEGEQTLTVQGAEPITSVEELAAIPLVTEPGQAPVLLGDIATVVQAEAPVTSYSRLDGSPAIALAVTKTPAGNTVEVSQAVKGEIDRLEDVLAQAGLEVNVAFDQAPFIEESVNGLAKKALIGLGFAVLLILVFLLSIRSTLVAAVSIPLSLLATFVVMRVTGETFNIITLGGLAIAIGRIVDDSIVVIENIKRHLSYGEHKREAIIGAVKEVAGAVTASTVTTVAVFAPILFVGGMVGELFRPFALTVTIAMLSSLVVALTIVPVLAYWFVPSPVHIDEEDLAHQREQAEAKERRGLWQRAYLPTLGAALRHPVITLVIATLLLGSTAGLATRLETNFMDAAGEDSVTVTQTFASATSLPVKDSEARVLEDALLELPEVETVQTTVGADGAMMMAMGGADRASFAVTLASGVDAVAAVDTVREAVIDLGGPRTSEITVTAGAGMNMMGGGSVDLVVTSADAQALAAAAQMVTDAARATEGVVEVTNNLSADQDTVAVVVRRDVAASAGLTETQVLGMVAAVMSSSSLGSIDTADGRLSVRMSMGAGPATLAELRSLPLAGPLTLGELAEVDVVQTQGAITRSDGQRTATVSVTPEGQDLGALGSRLQEAVDGLDLPVGATVELGGVIAMMNTSFNDLGLALLIAVAVVFIVMVATFGSLLQPFILLISIPFAATGALAGLLLTGQALGVPALIGMLMLIGIVVSNAIVLIDLINQYRERGRSLDEAIVEGARKRLRPILMTALATIFALAPMALGIISGGAFLSKPLAIVVIGGLLSSTFLTLVVVPVLYRYEARAHDRREARREERLEARRAERTRQRELRLATDG